MCIVLYWLIWYCVLNIEYAHVVKMNETCGKITWIMLKWIVFCYIIFIPICRLIFSLLVRNVITHSLCVVCVWILWWSWTLCSGKQMTRWISLRNLVLKDIKTQCSDRMWHEGISCYINCMRSWTTLFWAEMIY